MVFFSKTLNRWFFLLVFFLAFFLANCFVYGQDAQPSLEELQKNTFEWIPKLGANPWNRDEATLWYLNTFFVGLRGGSFHNLSVDSLLEYEKAIPDELKTEAHLGFHDVAHIRPFRFTTAEGTFEIPEQHRTPFETEVTTLSTWIGTLETSGLEAIAKTLANPPEWMRVLDGFQTTIPETMWKDVRPLLDEAVWTSKDTSPQSIENISVKIELAANQQKGRRNEKNRYLRRVHFVVRILQGILSVPNGKEILLNKTHPLDQKVKVLRQGQDYLIHHVFSGQTKFGKNQARGLVLKNIQQHANAVQKRLNLKMRDGQEISFLVSSGFAAMLRGSFCKEPTCATGTYGAQYQHRNNALVQDTLTLVPIIDGEIRGYFEFMQEHQVETKNKVLVLTTFQFDGMTPRNVLILFSHLHHQAVAAGFSGIAVPTALLYKTNIASSITMIEGLRAYKEGTKITVTPLHADEWKVASSSFGVDGRVYYQDTVSEAYTLLNPEHLASPEALSVMVSGSVPSVNLRAADSARKAFQKAKPEDLIAMGLSLSGEAYKAYATLLRSMHHNAVAETLDESFKNDYPNPAAFFTNRARQMHLPDSQITTYVYNALEHILKATHWDQARQQFRPNIDNIFKNLIGLLGQERVVKAYLESMNLRSKTTLAYLPPQTIVEILSRITGNQAILILDYIAINAWNIFFHQRSSIQLSIESFLQDAENVELCKAAVNALGALKIAPSEENKRRLVQLLETENPNLDPLRIPMMNLVSDHGADPDVRHAIGRYVGHHDRDIRTTALLSVVPNYVRELAPLIDDLYALQKPDVAPGSQDEVANQKLQETLDAIVREVQTQKPSLRVAIENAMSQMVWDILERREARTANRLFQQMRGFIGEEAFVRVFLKSPAICRPLFLHSLPPRLLIRLLGMTQDRDLNREILRSILDHRISEMWFSDQDKEELREKLDTILYSEATKLDAWRVALIYETFARFDMRLTASQKEILIRRLNTSSHEVQLAALNVLKPLVFDLVVQRVLLDIAKKDPDSSLILSPGVLMILRAHAVEALSPVAFDPEVTTVLLQNLRLEVKGNTGEDDSLFGTLFENLGLKKHEQINTLDLLLLKVNSAKALEKVSGEPPVRAALIKALSDPDFELKCTAAKSLSSQVSHPEVEKALVGLLDGPISPDMLRALSAAVSNPEIRSRVVEHLESPNGDLKIAAIDALGPIVLDEDILAKMFLILHSFDVTEETVHVIRNLKPHITHPHVQGEIIWWMDRVKRDLTTSDGSFGSQSLIRAMKEGIEALGLMAATNPRAQTILERYCNLSNSDPWLQRLQTETALALKPLVQTSESARTAVRELLKSSDPATNRVAIEILAPYESFEVLFNISVFGRMANTGKYDVLHREHMALAYERGRSFKPEESSLKTKQKALEIELLFKRLLAEETREGALRAFGMISERAETLAEAEREKVLSEQVQFLRTPRGKMVANHIRAMPLRMLSTAGHFGIALFIKQILQMTFGMAERNPKEFIVHLPEEMKDFALFTIGSAIGSGAYEIGVALPFHLFQQFVLKRLLQSSTAARLEILKKFGMTSANVVRLQALHTEFLRRQAAFIAALMFTQWVHTGTVDMQTTMESFSSFALTGALVRSTADGILVRIGGSAWKLKNLSGPWGYLATAIELGFVLFLSHPLEFYVHQTIEVSKRMSDLQEKSVGLYEKIMDTLVPAETAMAYYENEYQKAFLDYRTSMFWAPYQASLEKQKQKMHAFRMKEDPLYTAQDEVKRLEKIMEEHGWWELSKEVSEAESRYGKGATFGATNQNEIDEMKKTVAHISHLSHEAIPQAEKQIQETTWQNAFDEKLALCVEDLEEDFKNEMKSTRTKLESSPLMHRFLVWQKSGSEEDYEAYRDLKKFAGLKSFGPGNRWVTFLGLSDIGGIIPNPATDEQKIRMVRDTSATDNLLQQLAYTDRLYEELSQKEPHPRNQILLGFLGLKSIGLRQELLQMLDLTWHPQIEEKENLLDPTTEHLLDQQISIK